MGTRLTNLISSHRSPVIDILGMAIVIRWDQGISSDNSGNQPGEDSIPNHILPTRLAPQSTPNQSFSHHATPNVAHVRMPKQRDSQL